MGDLFNLHPRCQIIITDVLPLLFLSCVLALACLHVKRSGVCFDADGKESGGVSDRLPPSSSGTNILNILLIEQCISEMKCISAWKLHCSFAVNRGCF